MSTAILIMGESGSGKTTSLRNLPPKETFYIDADGKGLSWKGWRKAFNSENKNYVQQSKAEEISKVMDKLRTLDHVKYIVLDTINGVMLDQEMERIREKGYDKWVDLAENAYYIAQKASQLRDDQVVIILGHSETITTDDGFRQTRLKTNGRKLEKIVLESKFTTVLLCEQRGDGYVYVTRGQNTTAKTPLGMFNTDEIDNDITTVLEALKDY